MTDFKANDLVRVVRQSKTINSHIHSVGLSGYIEEIVGEYAQFVELKADSYTGTGGQGGVPLDCLELANDDIRLQQLKKVKDELSDKHYQEGLERTKKYQKERAEAIALAMDATKASKKDIERIIEIYKEFENKWSY